MNERTYIPRSPGKVYLLLALSCMGECELEVDEDIVLMLGDFTERRCPKWEKEEGCVCGKGESIKSHNILWQSYSIHEWYYMYTCVARHMDGPKPCAHDKN